MDANTANKEDNLKTFEGTLTSVDFLTTWFADDLSNDLLAFSQTCRAALGMSTAARKKHALKGLLTAVAEGNEAIACKILTLYPELLLDSSATAIDLAGKKIKDLSPLKAAICAGDVDMVRMMQKVLQHKLQSGMQLGFEPESEMWRQFKEIYPDGIDPVEAEQKVQAQEFKRYILRNIFNTINAATPDQVIFELQTPGQDNANSPLNAALRNFRAEFSSTSNQELIFNPFYLLMAFELNIEEGDNAALSNNDVCNRLDLFWRQIIGYIQRHLPACYLQEFAQGISFGALKRDFHFPEDINYTMLPLPLLGDLDKLGYHYACGPGWCERVSGAPMSYACQPTRLLQELSQRKKSDLEELFTRGFAARDSCLDQGRCVIA